MNSAYFTPPHRIPAGNYFEMAVKLSQLTWGNNTQGSIPFTPEPGDRFQVLLVQHGGKNYRCSNVSINGTTLTFSINGDIAIGLYSLEIIVTRADNKRLRSLQKNKIEIVFSNEEAGIPDDDEFQTHTITLGGAILMIVDGAELQWDDTPRIGSGAAVTSDGIAQALNALAESVSESSSTSSSVINLNNLLSSTNTYTLTTAIEALAAYESSTGKTYRKSGLVLTYKTDTDTWESKQFQGAVADFTDETLWTDFGSGGGGEIEVDDELDTESENPVQNKVVAEAIERLNAKVFPFTITLNGGGTYELGSSQNVNLSWSYTDNGITSQSINNDPVTNDVRSKSFSNVSANTTYTLRAVFGGTTYSKSVSANFQLRKYYGTSAKAVLENADILLMSTAWATGVTLAETNMNCEGGKYIYYIIPTAMAPASLPDFRVGGFANSDWEVTTQDVTNASGHTVSYTIYRLRNIQTGNPITLQVK